MIQALYIIIWEIVQVSMLLSESGLPKMLNLLRASRQNHTAKVTASALYHSKFLSFKSKPVCSHSWVE